MNVCVAWNGCPTKGGDSIKYCCGQKQTVVKISALFRCRVLSCSLLSWPFSPCSLSVSIYHSPTLTKAHTENPNCFATFRRVLLPVHVLSLSVVAVSSKPKEPGAAVVAPGRSSAQPSVRQGLHCCRSRSGSEVRWGWSSPRISFLHLSDELDS